MTRITGWSRVTVLLVCLPLSVGAQDTEQDQLKKQLTEQKEMLGLQKDVISAQKDLVDAQTGLFQSKLPTLPEGKSGAISIESGAGDTFHTTVQAYAALSEAAQKLCQVVINDGKGENPRRSVAILGADDLRLASQYRLVRDEAAALSTSYGEALSDKKFAVQGGAEAGLIVSTLVDISKLFRTDKKFFFSSPTVADSVLLDEVALCLTKSTELNGKVGYSAAELEHALASDKSKLMESIRELSKSDIALAKKIKDVEATPPEKRTQPQKDSLAEWQALSTRFQNFKKALEGTDSTTKLTIMMAALQGEAAEGMLEGRKRLSATVATKGGTTLVTSSLISSDRMYTSGGVIVTYRLIDQNVLRAAGAIPVESPFVEFKKHEGSDRTNQQ